MASCFQRCGLNVARVVLLAVLPVCAILLTVQAQQPQTVKQGVYTENQAKRGQALYKDRCSSCHGERLEGRLGPPLTGEDFIYDWAKQPLSELFSKIRNTMPQDNPGKLTAQETADIVAYILQSGKFPAGRADLGSDEAVLKQITWPAENAAPSKPAQGASSPSFPPAGNLAQVMRGILFPNSNIIFTVQTHDPAEKKTTPEGAAAAGGFNWTIWGSDIYPGWELVDYAAVALAESAPLMLTPGRRCENGKPVPVNDLEWLKFTEELADAGRAAYKAAQTRNQETVSDVSGVIADACLHCHQVYRDKGGRGRDPADPSNKASRCVK
ncbi:MAG TPA: cytochrome c [Terriglobia bacterium]|nr:cytochrome c [Terriglobia bacterium]